MTDRPILFSGPMVCALLAGTKTQTRRIAQVAGGIALSDITEWVEEPSGFRRAVFRRDQIAEPRFTVGDRLYVREAWRTEAAYDDLSPSAMGGEEPIRYDADGAHQSWGYPAISKLGRFRQGMHMPRWASRMTLNVCYVRVHRLQDISEEDAKAEGMSGEFCDYELYGQSKPYRYEFSGLWNSLNADRGYGWDVNPWVVAVAFTVDRRNIDEVAA